MAGTVRFTATVRRAFLEHLKNTANVTEAARRVNISRSRMYDLRRKDPALAQGWDEALAATTDRLEAEAIRRAVEGVKKPYFYQGKECGEMVEYSDPLLKFLLQKRLPDRYGDGAQAGEVHPDSGQGRVVFEMHLGLDSKGCPGQGKPDHNQADDNQSEPERPNPSQADPDLHHPEGGCHE